MVQYQTMGEQLQPKVTIGIPTYNRPEGLANTLKRATSQTYENLEILVSDNASSDREAVRSVIDSFQQDSRVSYHRQEENLGSLGNFQFLVNKASGDYFLWMSDDDDVELNYIERLVDALNENPDVAIVMGGYDIEDQMADPVIKLNLTQHLAEMSIPDLYQRMKTYILQPDHLAKSRLNWGMFPREHIKRAFQECHDNIPEGNTPIWADYPIDLRLLSYGNLTVVNEVLWHVKLLPTSDGKSTLAGSFQKMSKISDHTRVSMSAVVRDSSLNEDQKNELYELLKTKSRKEKLQLFMYYSVISRSPWLARQVKNIWYRLFS